MCTGGLDMPVRRFVLKGADSLSAIGLGMQEKDILHLSLEGDENCCVSRDIHQVYQAKVRNLMKSNKD